MEKTRTSQKVLVLHSHIPPLRGPTVVFSDRSFKLTSTRRFEL